MISDGYIDATRYGVVCGPIRRNDPVVILFGALEIAVIFQGNSVATEVSSIEDFCRVCWSHRNIREVVVAHSRRTKMPRRNGSIERSMEPVGIVVTVAGELELSPIDPHIDLGYSAYRHIYQFRAH